MAIMKTRRILSTIVFGLFALGALPANAQSAANLPPTEADTFLSPETGGSGMKRTALSIVKLAPSVAVAADSVAAQKDSANVGVLRNRACCCRKVTSGFPSLSNYTTLSSSPYGDLLRLIQYQLKQPFDVQ